MKNSNIHNHYAEEEEKKKINKQAWYSITLFIYVKLKTYLSLHIKIARQKRKKKRTVNKRTLTKHSPATFVYNQEGLLEFISAKKISLQIREENITWWLKINHNRMRRYNQLTE